MTLTITAAAVVRLCSGNDHVSLSTNIRNPLWPYTGNLTLHFEAPRGGGHDFVREHLGLEAEVIVDNSSSTFPRRKS